MATREKVISLAKVDTAAALACAPDVSDARFRCQALGWIARYAPDDEFERIANLAMAAAAEATILYERATAIAWPIRAVCDRGAPAIAVPFVVEALRVAAKLDHPGSQSEALILLFQAAIIGPQTLWNPILQSIMGMPYPPLHWRHGRALRDAILMTHARDPELGRRLCETVTDEKTKRRIEKEIAEGGRHQPRRFYW